ncbi:MAG: hypothetical protein HY925_12905, partial [Elusimicrobia bacterium]|nr:hypothetical protein [Elusimicrobiota bacterium]
MIVRAEGSTRLSRLAASVLSSILLVPASGGLFPALAQMRVQTVPTTVGTPVVPGVVGQQPGAQIFSPAMTTQLGPTLKQGLTIQPVLTTRGVSKAATVAGSNASAQPLASGIQVISAGDALPSIAGAKGQTIASPAQQAQNGGAPTAVESAIAAANPEKAAESFDGVGIRKSDKVYNPELNLENRPQAPESKHSINEISLPSQRTLKGGVLNSIFGWVFGPDDAIILPNNPTDEAGVEAGLRELIRQRPDMFAGLSSDAFRTRHVRKVAGKAGLSDTFYANFQQQKDTLGVEGSYVNFVVKVMGGKTVVLASNAELFPETNSVDTTGRLSDDQLRGKASERLGTPPASGDTLRDLDRKVLFIGGQWRAVQVFFHEKMMVMVAVDVVTGQTFAWDPRMNAGQQGSVAGRGVADGPFDANAALDVMSIAHLEITGPGGKFYSDKDGKFTVPGSGTEPVQLKMRLTGRYANVSDKEGKDLTVTVTAKPGEELRVVFNPEGMDEGAVAQVNGYVHTTGVHDWLVAQGIKVAALDKPMLVNVNIDDECNAYYTPWNPSLNFFKKSSRCANSSMANVNRHEYGHAVDDAIGGIQNGGLSEGWGDIIARYMGNAPEIGKGFFFSNPWDPTKPPPPYLRIGTNDYKYNPR